MRTGSGLHQSEYHPPTRFARAGARVTLAGCGLDPAAFEGFRLEAKNGRFRFIPHESGHALRDAVVAEQGGRTRTTDYPDR